MNCRRCGKNLGDKLKCEFCGYENVAGNVREMTRTEKNFFDGVTINADGTEYEGQSRSGGNFKSGKAYINLGESSIFSRLFGKFIFGLMNNNLLAKIAAILIFVAFAALMFFIALPILFFLLALGIAMLIYAKFTKKF